MRDETRFQLEQMLFRMFDRIEVEELAKGLADRRPLDLVGMHLKIRDARERYREQGIPLDEGARIAIVSEVAMEVLGNDERRKDQTDLKDYVPKPTRSTTPGDGSPDEPDKPKSFWRKVVVSGLITSIVIVLLTGGVFYYRIQHDGVTVECAVRDFLKRHLTEIHTCTDAKNAAGEATPPTRKRSPR
jgi:hypothetical protein